VFHRLVCGHRAVALGLGARDHHGLARQLLAPRPGHRRHQVHEPCAQAVFRVEAADAGVDQLVAADAVQLAADREVRTADIDARAGQFTAAVELAGELREGLVDLRERRRADAADRQVAGGAGERERITRRWLAGLLAREGLIEQAPPFEVVDDERLGRRLGLTAPRQFHLQRLAQEEAAGVPPELHQCLQGHLFE